MKENCDSLPCEFKEFKIRFMSWDISDMNIIDYQIATKLLEDIRYAVMKQQIIDILNDLHAVDYNWAMVEFHKRPLNENGKQQLEKGIK